GVSSQTNWRQLEALGCVRSKEVIRHHEVQYLISPARRFLKVFHTGSVFARRLWDTSQQRRLVGILHSERLDGLMKIIIRGRRKAISAIPQVDEVCVTREDLFLGPALGSILLAHLSLDPQGEADCFYFQEELVCARHTNDEGENVRKNPSVLKHVAVNCAGQLLQEVAAHELLGDRRPPLRKHARTVGITFSSESCEMRCQGSHVCLDHQTKEGGIVHSGMREKVFV